MLRCSCGMSIWILLWHHVSLQVILFHYNGITDTIFSLLYFFKFLSLFLSLLFCISLTCIRQCDLSILFRPSALLPCRHFSLLVFASVFSHFRIGAILILIDIQYSVIPATRCTLPRHVYLPSTTRSWCQACITVTDWCTHSSMQA